MLAGAAEADAAAERLAFRHRLAAGLATHIRAAIAAGHLPEQDAEFAAAAVIGAVMEGLLGPLPGEPGTAEARHTARHRRSRCSPCVRLASSTPAWSRRGETALAQCAIRTGTVMVWRMPRVAPPSTNSRRREWP